MEGFFGSSGGVGGGVLLAANEIKNMVWARSLDFSLTLANKVRILNKVLTSFAKVKEKSKLLAHTIFLISSAAKRTPPPTPPEDPKKPSKGLLSFNSLKSLCFITDSYRVGRPPKELARSLPSFSSQDYARSSSSSHHATILLETHLMVFSSSSGHRGFLTSPATTFSSSNNSNLPAVSSSSIKKATKL